MLNAGGGKAVGVLKFRFGAGPAPRFCPAPAGTEPRFVGGGSSTTSSSVSILSGAGFADAGGGGGVEAGSAFTSGFAGNCGGGRTIGAGAGAGAGLCDRPRT